MSRTPANGPPLGLVAPFFLAAPAGLIAAGLLLATSGTDVFVAINLPRTVAITHALVLGWITTTMMGAVYQLAPVVLRGDLWSQRVARVQFGIHLVAVTWFVLGLKSWSMLSLGIAGVLLVTSFILFVLNAAVAVGRAPGWSHPRMYLAVSLTFLVGAFSLGITYVGTLQHLWFPVSLGRLSAHAHIGLVGWIGLTLMGVSYQLVPMFAVVQHAKPRFAGLALSLTGGALLLFAWSVANGAGPGLRVLLGALLALGPALWGIDQVRLLKHRTRRRLDVHGRATIFSLVFLALAIAVGVAAASGTPLTTDTQPARWLLAYAAAAIGGWAGLSLIGNTYKILPFLIWYHRYLPHAGERQVPVTADIYHEGAANVVAGTHAAAVLLLTFGALIGSLDVFRAGGAVLAAGGALHALTMAHMFLPKTASQTIPRPGTREVTQ